MNRMPYPRDEDWIHPSNNRKNLQLSYARSAISQLSKGHSVCFTGPAPLQVAQIDEKTLPDHQKLVFGTGGTTGKPKRVIHLESSLSSAVDALTSRVGEESFSFVNCLPLNHVGGWMQIERAIRTKGQVFFCSHKDLTGQVSKSITQGKWLSLVPTQLHFLVSSPFACESLRACKGILVGGAALSEELSQKCRDLQLPVYPTYGMTETAGMVTLLDADDFLNGNSSVGFSLPHAELGLQGNVNRIAIKSQSLCLAREGVVFEPNHWYLSDDFGMQDQKGHWFVLGRLDRMIKTGGEMVNPAIVEKIIMRNPEVRECSVVAERDERWGEVVTAWIAPGNLSENSIRDNLKGHLQDHEIPKKWYMVDELPRSHSGMSNRLTE